MEEKKIKKNRIINFIVIITLSILLVISVGIIYVNKTIYDHKAEDYELIIETLRENARNNRPSKNASLINEIDEYIDTYYKGDPSSLEIEELINYYLASLDDPYAYYYSKEEWEKQNSTYSGNSVGIGVIVSYYQEQIVVCKVFDDSPAFNAGIKVGDIIKGTKDIDFSTLEYEECVANIKGEKGTKVTLEIDRSGEQLELEVLRNDYVIQTVFLEIVEKDSKKVGVIQITNFYETTVMEFIEAVTECMDEECVGIIFDVRSNPGGLLSSVVSILDSLLPEGPICKINYKDESESYTINSDASCICSLPFVVLADENSASAAELFTSTLKDYGIAKVIGTKTYGKGCGQTMYNLSNGGVIKFTTFLYDPPFSENYNGTGIIPDIEVILSDEAQKKSIYLLTKEEDTQLARAIEELTK